MQELISYCIGNSRKYIKEQANILIFNNVKHASQL